MNLFKCSSKWSNNSWGNLFARIFHSLFQNLIFKRKIFCHVKETAHRHPAKGQDKGETSKWGSEIKCFKCLGRGRVASQCPTKRTIVLKGQDLNSSQGESSKESSSSSDSHKDKSSKDKLHSYPQERSLLMIRRLLNNQPTILSMIKEKTFFTLIVTFWTILVL